MKEGPSKVRPLFFFPHEASANGNLSMSAPRRPNSLKKRCGSEPEYPDANSPGFKVEAHRQSLAVARSPHAKRDQDFVDAISDDCEHD
jgi:hypothetical protein